jgi:hypothetical protein
VVVRVYGRAPAMRSDPVFLLALVIRLANVETLDGGS